MRMDDGLTELAVLENLWGRPRLWPHHRGWNSAGPACAGGGLHDRICGPFLIHTLEKD